MHTDSIIIILSALLAAEARLQSRTHDQFIKRQTATGGTTATNPCTDTCTPFLTTAPSCGATVSCICKTTVQQDLQTCLNCLVETGSPADQLSSSITDFNGACSSSGLTVNLPTSAAGSASGAPASAPSPVPAGGVPSGAGGSGQVPPPDNGPTVTGDGAIGSGAGVPAAGGVPSTPAGTAPVPATPVATGSAGSTGLSPSTGTTGLNSNAGGSDSGLNSTSSSSPQGQQSTGERPATFSSYALNGVVALVSFGVYFM
ncbi:hypothetical protein CPB84DRAFT_1009651 [Gymnopilus junonius]|uniref:Extracellular membrane protein CFEM domain-containing protein n=1 Tax=Gymnopilus junonius TaxID=109634 RepID=A0A9P5TNZ8_GYMJU|nr:hypothetical protein CPB84DRAFT_1009651 [Gymnopilus junonius]